MGRMPHLRRRRSRTTRRLANQNSTIPFRRSNSALQTSNIHTSIRRALPTRILRHTTLCSRRTIDSAARILQSVMAKAIVVHPRRRFNNNHRRALRTRTLNNNHLLRRRMLMITRMNVCRMTFQTTRRLFKNGLRQGIIRHRANATARNTRRTSNGALTITPATNSSNALRTTNGNQVRLRRRRQLLLATRRRQRIQGAIRTRRSTPNNHKSPTAVHRTSMKLRRIIRRCHRIKGVVINGLPTRRFVGRGKRLRGMIMVLLSRNSLT